MQPTSRWVERLSRVGILAKAVTHLIIGLLATGVALNIGGALTGAHGLFRLLLNQPLGRIMLGLLAFGLAAYSLWLFVQATLDPDDKGKSFTGLIDRAAQVISGVAHAALAFEAGRLAARLPGVGGGGLEAWIARLLREPWGVWVVGLAGLVVVVLGGIQMQKALAGDVRKNWRLRELDPVRDRWRFRVGRFGLAARGFVFATAGALVVRAALAYDPSKVGGVDDVLRTLQDQFTADWLLGTVAVGLVAYGFFALIEARFRFIPSE